MIFDRLHPSPGPVSAPELLAELRADERVPDHRPLVRLNMVATVDGRATLGGGSREIGGAGDRRMFAELRVLPDAVLIGTGTLRSEPYGRLVRDPGRRARRVAAGLAEDPIAVLFSRGLDLPWESPLFSVPTQPVVIACRAEAANGFTAPATPAPVTLLPLPEPTLAAALRGLRELHGVRVLLCEGGPILNAHLVAEGLLDELFLTVGPVLSGEADTPGILAQGEEADPSPHRRLELSWVLRHGSELLLRYTAGPGGAAEQEAAERDGQSEQEQEGEIEERDHGQE